MKRRSVYAWAELLLGLLLLALGIYTYIHPNIAVSVTMWGYSLVAIVTGAVDIIFYFKMSRWSGRGSAVSFVAGLLSILAGLMIMLNPALGNTIFNLVFSIWFISHSVARLANIRFIRKVAGRGVGTVSMVCNILGVALGVVMLFFPSVLTHAFGYLVATGLTIHGVSGLVDFFSKIGRKDVF